MNTSVIRILEIQGDTPPPNKWHHYEQTIMTNFIQV